MNRMASNGASRNKVSHSKPGPLVSAERTRCPRRVSVSPNWTSLLRLPGMGAVTFTSGKASRARIRLQETRTSCHSTSSVEWHLPPLRSSSEAGEESLNDSHGFMASIDSPVELLMGNKKPHRNAVCKQFL